MSAKTNFPFRICEKQDFPERITQQKENEKLKPQLADENIERKEKKDCQNVDKRRDTELTRDPDR